MDMLIKMEYLREISRIFKGILALNEEEHQEERNI